MSQRLGIAAALLGDPAVLMFDEPVNGLDPEGIRWIRNLMRGLAAEGRTVLVSSHLMSEMALTADHLVVIGRGRLIADTGVDDFVRSQSRQSMLVRTPSAAAFAERLAAEGASVTTGTEGALVVSGLDGLEIGRLALTEGVVLSELTPQRTSLEDGRGLGARDRAAAAGSAPRRHQRRTARGRRDRAASERAARSIVSAAQRCEPGNSAGPCAGAMSLSGRGSIPALVEETDG